MSIDLDREAFATMPKPPRKRTSGGRRQPTRFELWAWSQVLSFQIGLTAGYLALVYFGLASGVATVPAIQETSPEGYVIFWSVGLTLGAAVAAVGSIGSRKPGGWRTAEMWGSSLVSLTVGSYAAILTTVAYVLGDVDRVSGSAGFTALAIPLIIRTLWLWSQLKRK